VSLCLNAILFCLAHLEQQLANSKNDAEQYKVSELFSFGIVGCYNASNAGYMEKEEKKKKKEEEEDYSQWLV